MRASSRLFLLAVLAVAVPGCASVTPMDAVVARPAAPPSLRFGVDTFAFPNESRSKNQGKPDLYANYCFVMARGVTQFQRFARFDAAASRVTPEEYVARIKQVVGHRPWEDPLPPDDRVVIPGYASLYEFSRDQEAVVKEGLVGRFWTLVHWTTWRVESSVPGSHQERVARQFMLELQAGRPVQLLVTNFPTWELHHTVIAYAYGLDPTANVLLPLHRPNNPREPRRVTFDGAHRCSAARKQYDTHPGPI